MKTSTHLTLAATLLTGLALTTGCEHHDALLQYNPQLDSVLPTYYNATPDASILDDQRTTFAKMRDAAATAKPAPVAASAPAAPPA